MEAMNSNPPALPRISIDDLNLAAVSMNYDRESDTLMLHLTDIPEPGISIVVDDHLLVRMDRERQRVLGFQIEGFLAYVVQRHPRLLDALDAADLRGISFEEVTRLRRTIVPDHSKAEAVEEVMSWITQPGHAAD